MEQPIIRCALAMLGTDVHSKGIRTLAGWLRDAGVEVIYLGEHNIIGDVINVLIQEDADVLGLSFSSGGYLAYVEQVADAKKQAGLDDVALMVGGQIHPNDHDRLKAAGVTGIFGPGTTKDQVLDYLYQLKSPVEG